ncbi:carbohydrate binding domain-containing protein [Hymenobacter cavernae]|uniref:CBM-cenC domain-containing protein n=1 Tax=Hymenobacter cavernae TaxID=2044852 RepID=A0ABQ1TVJ1_9BACT|nr:carbohydrate binding domain-containing protein [Hymenobacter cavernae]GGF04581.1 hypothetical protein GCM10011383_14610 [Hymenobacter cavernae]
MKNFFCFLVLASFISSCSSDDELTAGPNTITANDFESLAGWVGGDQATLTKTRAHSGKYALEVSNGHDFSLTYDAVLGQISPRKLKKVRLEAWAFRPNPNAKGVLGIQIVDPAQDNKPVAGDGIYLESEVKEFNKWVKVSKDITLPDNLVYTQHLRLFLWRGAGSEPNYVDDVSLTILD